MDRAGDRRAGFWSACLLPALVAAITLAGCSRDATPGQSSAPASPATAPAPAAAASSQPGPVQIEMKNLHMHLADDLIVKVRHLRGEMISRMPGQPPTFDDPRAYMIDVDVAEILATMKRNTERAREALGGVLPLLRDRPEACPHGCDRALDVAILTPPEARDPDLVAKLDAVAGRVLRPRNGAAS